MIILLLFLSFFFSQKNDKIFKLEIPCNYYGWVFVVGTSNEKIIKTNSDIHIVDTNGICYVDTSIFLRTNIVKYYKNGKELTPLEVKFFFVTKMNYPKKGKKHFCERQVYFFYVLNEEDIKKGDAFWDSYENRMPISAKQRERENYLLSNKIIRLE